MSLVLPRHLIAHTFGEARGRGGRIMALVAIAGGLVAVGILAFAPSGPIGSGGVAMLPAAAALLVFVDCMKELPATLLLRPLNVETLATHVYAAAARGTYEDGAIAALMIILAGLAPVVLLSRVGTRHAAEGPVS